MIQTSTSVNQNKGKSTESTESDPNKPLPFFGTEAHLLPQGDDTYKPRSQYTPIVVMVSTIVFMVYFCILREENDIDELLSRDLYDHFGPEASRLKKAYDYNIKNNLPTTEIVRRLQEIGAPAPPPANRR